MEIDIGNRNRYWKQKFEIGINNENELLELENDVGSWTLALKL